MSRIGKKTISFPTGVTVVASPTEVAVNSSKGQIKVPIPGYVVVDVTDSVVKVTRTSQTKQARANHGLVRSLVQNAITGVTTGFTKRLKLVGTGYRVQAKGANLDLAVGLSHPVEFRTVPGVTLVVEGNDTIVVSGMDKHLVGQVAANIRKIRPPEVYKGKGIRYEDEVLRLKPGKTAA
jgi:large subunit ribosomal protein L6